jgi:large subunit ribosomal protein L15
MDMHQLKNTHRPRKKSKRLGRGPGCKKGKTSGRGEKGDGSRSGYKRRLGYEGGRQPLHRKLPIRGFSRHKHIIENFELNLDQIEKLFNDSDTVSISTLKERGFLSKNFNGKLRILGRGEIKKKLTIEAHHFTKSAEKQLTENNIGFSKAQ